MPYTWDWKEMAFVSNLEFPVRLETCSWTFGNDREEMNRGGGSLSFPWVRLQAWGRWLGMTGLKCPNFARVLVAAHTESQAVSAEGREVVMAVISFVE